MADAPAEAGAGIEFGCLDLHVDEGRQRRQSITISIMDAKSDAMTDSCVDVISEWIVGDNIAAVLGHFGRDNGRIIKKQRPKHRSPSYESPVSTRTVSDTK